MVRKKSPDTVVKSPDGEDIEELNDDEIVNKSDGDGQGGEINTELENHVGVEDSGDNDEGDDISDSEGDSSEEEEPIPEMTAEERENAMKESDENG